MGNSSYSNPSSKKNINWDKVSNTLEALCEETGYELGEDDYGNISIYDREYDTELVFTDIFMDMMEYNEEIYLDIMESPANFLKTIIKAYYEAPEFLKLSNGFIMFDDYSNHQVLQDNKWDALHQSIDNYGHGILISDRALNHPNGVNPFEHTLYHEMAHGHDFSIRDDFGRRNGATQTLMDTIDKYGSATDYSKDNYGRGFRSEFEKYQEDFAEIIGITTAYKVNPNFKVRDGGVNISAKKWVENHKELVQWAESYVNSYPEQNIDPPANMDASMFF